MLLSAALLLSLTAGAQDSLKIKIYPKYDEVGKFHRFLFGENYRKEYAMETMVPIIRISKIKGGLSPIKRGGGNQTHSLRLEDKNGKEWVLRTVEKYPEILLPVELRKTFAGDAIKDNMSAQQPFSALIVPTIADAAGVPHSEPMIGWIVPDDNLGEYAEVFQNTLCLLEAREPEGDTDNTFKMLRKMNEDGDVSVDAKLFLKAKAMDALMGDWDRHEDQWRWKPEKTGQGTNYVVIPRDRDQVFYVSQGLFPRIAQASWLLPMIQGYERNINNINWFFWEGRSTYTRLLGQLSKPEWDAVVTEFCSAMTDQLFEQALRKLPEPGYSLRHDRLLAMLKERRATLPAMMEEYYNFINRIVDVQASDKNELVMINDAPGKSMEVSIRKIAKDGQLKDRTFHKVYDPELTKEIRVYLRDGNDSLVVNNKTSDIRLRVVGVHGQKNFHVENSKSRIPLYVEERDVHYSGNTSVWRKHLSNDTSNTHYVPTDLYTRKMTLLNLGFNADDGVLAGLSFKVMRPGFRKLPFGNVHSFSFLHAFKSEAFNFKYTGEWFEALGNADVTLHANAYAPENSQNFFGLGNETPFYKTGNFVRYYRARFSLYELNPAVRWHKEHFTWSVGPAFQYYRFNKDDNGGRFINDLAALHSPDSALISADKLYAGVMVNFEHNTRNNEVIPSRGTYLFSSLKGYTGINEDAKSSVQLETSFSFYKKLDASGRLVLANRTGGALTFGKQAFYQSSFLGGQGNLLGYRAFRFGGQHSLYNNLEVRAKVANFDGYILPGQFGLTGFFDTGRVWVKNDRSDVWHYSYGGGVYYAPAILAVIQLQVANSEEGTYPYITMKFRY
ncbi:outer membrane protein [Pedobacter sp. BAL39]|nr:outer membrane protein [Pedobacter sp. BAL39]